MAVTYTNTTTRTYTRARMHLIRVQFRKSFATRFAYTPTCIEALPGAVEEQLVSSLTVYADTSAGESVASVTLRIDWGAHGTSSRRPPRVSIDARSRDDVSPQLEVFEESFEDFVEEQGLVLDRRIELSEACRDDPTRYEATFARLDLVPADPIRWKNKPLGQTERIRGLAEMSAEVQFADDEA